MTGAPDILRAFPSSAIDDRLGGMSLRDWFAGQALTTVASYPPDDVTTWVAADFAAHAYHVADAMMAARAQKPEPKPAKTAGSDCDHGFTEIFECPECRPF